MTSKINEFSHEQMWKILDTYTFTAGSRNKVQKWFSNIIFHIDGTLENTEKTVGLRRWEFSKDRIEFYDKNGKLSQFALFATSKITENGFEMRLNFPNKSLEDYNSLFSDGLKQNHEFFPSVFYEEKNKLLYQNSGSVNYPYFFKVAQLKVDKDAKYILSVDIRVEDIFSLIDNDIFFKFLIFDDESEIDLLSGENHELSINFENITSKKWKHIEKEFSFTRDYISYGPYLVGCGKVEFKNIKLEREKKVDVPKIKKRIKE